MEQDTKPSGFCMWCYRHKRADLADQMPGGGRALSRWLATHLPLDPDLMRLYQVYARGHTRKETKDERLGTGAG
jgi:hypothetical protein